MPFIMEDHQVSIETLGAVISSHNLAFSFSKLFFGLGSYLLNPRVMFSGGLFVSSLCVLTFCFISHILYVTPIWFVSGIAQGTGWPAASMLLTMWFPVHERGTVWSLLAASINLPGILTPILVPYFIDAFGYRAYMCFIGCSGLLVSISCAILLRNDPESCGFSPFVSPCSNRAAVDKGDNVFKLILQSPSFWVLSLKCSIVYGVMSAFDGWARVYLIQERDMPINHVGTIISCFEFGGLISCLITGFFTDFAVKNRELLGLNKTCNPRLLISTMYAFISVYCIHLFRVSQIDSLHLPCIIFGLSLYGCNNVLGVVSTEEAPAKFGVTVHAICSFIASLGGVLTGFPLSALADYTSWSFAFVVLQSLLCLCVCVSLGTCNRDMAIGKKIKQE